MQRPKGTIKMNNINQVKAFISHKKQSGVSDSEIFTHLKENVTPNIFSEFELISFINRTPSDEVKKRFKPLVLFICLLLFTLGTAKCWPLLSGEVEFTSTSYLLIAAGFLLPATLSYPCYKMVSLHVFQITAVLSMANMMLNLSGTRLLGLADLALAMIAFMVFGLCFMVMIKAYPGCTNFHKKVKVPGENRFISR